MSSDLEPRPERTPVLRRAVAGLVLAAVVVLVFHALVGLIMGVFWVVVAIAAVAAVLWALNTLL